MKWISVNKRLPKNNNELKIIRYGRRSNGEHIGIKLAYMFELDNMKNVRMWDFEFGSRQCKVTHWCNIPKFEK